MTAASATSVVVLSGGRPDKLLECLRSLARQSRLPAEVIVVDNDATVATAELLEDIDAPFALRREQAGAMAFAEARNRGVAAAAGPIVAFLDDDCYADRWWIERLEQALTHADAVGGVVLPARDHRTPPDFVPELNWTVGLSSSGLLSESGGRLDLPSTSNMAFRKTVWEKLPFQELGGSLDTPDAAQNYRLGREDAAWWRALRRAGVRTGIARRALVFHDIDRARYSAIRTRDRAENDGKAHWTRERPAAELESAAEDTVHSAVRVFFDALRSERTLAQARRLHGTWARRQAALMRSAVDDANVRFSPGDRATLLTRATVRLAGDLIKPLTRGGAALAHHEIKRIRPLPSSANPPRRVLIVCYNFLGDAVLAMPMLRQLREAFAESHVTLLTGPAAAPLFEEAAFVDEIVELPGGLRMKNPRDNARVYRAVADARPDVILVTYFHGAPPLGLFAATDAPVICWDGDHGMAQKLWQDLATAVVPKSYKKPEVAALLDLLAPLKIATRLERPQWSPSGRAQSRASELMAQWGLEAGGFVVIPLDGVPGTWKFWPAKHWAAVARHLREKHGLRTVFTGLRGSRGLFESLGLNDDTAISTHGLLDTAELGALIARSRACVSVDSGPPHLAQALGVPTLTLFGPTDERRWGPLPRLRNDGDAGLPFRTVRAIDAAFEWMPHELAGQPADIYFQRLTVERVIEAVDGLLRDFAPVPAR